MTNTNTISRNFDTNPVSEISTKVSTPQFSKNNSLNSDPKIVSISTLTTYRSSRLKRFYVKKPKDNSLDFDKDTKKDTCEQICMFAPVSPEHSQSTNIVLLPSLPDKRPKRTSAPHVKVSPIRKAETCSLIYNTLYAASKQYGHRNATIFALGLAIGRRTSDILNLKVGDVYTYRDIATPGEVKRTLTLKESKTGKTTVELTVSESTREILGRYIATLKNKSADDPLFPSRKRDGNGQLRGIDITQYNKILKQVDAVLQEAGSETRHVSSYGMRKTFGWRLYDFYMRTNNGVMENGIHVLRFLQALYNHSDERHTLRYIGAWDDMYRKTAEAIDAEYPLDIRH